MTIINRRTFLTSAATSALIALTANKASSKTPPQLKNVTATTTILGRTKKSDSLGTIILESTKKEKSKEETHNLFFIPDELPSMRQAFQFPNIEKPV